MRLGGPWRTVIHNASPRLVFDRSFAEAESWRDDEVSAPLDFEYLVPGQS